MKQCYNAILQQCNNATDITKHEGNTMNVIQQCNVATTLPYNSSTEIKKQRKHNEVNTTMLYCNNAILKHCYRD